MVSKWCEMDFATISYGALSISSEMSLGAVDPPAKVEIVAGEKEI